MKKLTKKVAKFVFELLFGKTQTRKEVYFSLKKRPKYNKINNPFVSCVVPAYNEEQSIERCIQSLLRSTYKNKEILIINDGSTDNTERIIRGLMKKHKEIRLMNNKENIGVGMSRTKAVNASKGAYLLFMDAHSEQLSKTFIQDYLKEFTDEHVGVVKGGETWKPDTLVDKVIYYCGGLRPTREGFDLLNSPNTMYLKKCFLDVGGMDVNWGSDLSITSKVLEASWKIRYAYHVKIVTDYTKMKKRHFDVIYKYWLYGIGFSRNYTRYFVTLLRRRIDMRIVGGGLLNLAAIILVIIKPYLYPLLIVTLLVTRSHSLAIALRYRAPFIYILMAPLVLTLGELAYACGFIYGNLKRLFGIRSKLV